MAAARGRQNHLGFELLILGSDPERAPPPLNQWGYIAEEM